MPTCWKSSNHPRPRRRPEGLRGTPLRVLAGALTLLSGNIEGEFYERIWRMARSDSFEAAAG